MAWQQEQLLDFTNETPSLVRFIGLKEEKSGDRTTAGFSAVKLAGPNLKPLST
jgi:hypothetical protein